MDQKQDEFTQDVAKVSPQFDTIPEDIQLTIIRFIQSGKKSEGTKDEREKGRRSRNSALSAVALSCRTLNFLWQSELLSDVTLPFRSLMSFYLGLARNPDYGKLVRSITFIHREFRLTPEEVAESQNDHPEVIKALRSQGVKSEEEGTTESIVEGVYRFLPNIQTIIIYQSQFSIPFQSRMAGPRLVTLPFLTHSLKKLFMPKWSGVEANLKARNVVWILVFCTGLRSVVLGCVFDPNDFKYLVQLSDTFSGLSQVQKLSLGVDFSSSEQFKRYWEAAVGEQWIGGNRKSQAVFYLLKVTKNLQCLEINNISDQPPPINSSFLSALQSSYLTLESIRLFGMGVNHNDPEEYKASTNFALFEKLKMFSLDGGMLQPLLRSSDVRLPDSLEILFIPYYYTDISIPEDLEVARSFKVRSFSSLKAIILPLNLILKDCSVPESDDFKKRWLEGRRELEKAEVIKSGKVKLRLVEPGEFVGESSEIDFMSTLEWLSPP